MNGITLDVFKGDGFNTMSLTTRINEIPFTPQRVSASGLFTEVPVPTTVVAIENYKGYLTLVPNTPRSAAANPMTRGTRNLRYFASQHFPVSDTIVPDEIQNIRPLPGQGELEVANTVIERKFKSMSASLDATVEFGRVGAVKGIILDSDNSTVIYNLFTEFGITQPTMDYLLGTSTTSMVSNGTDLNNAIEDVLGEQPYTGIVVLCGKTFWKRFTTHPTVVDAYKYFEAQNQKADLNPNRDDMRYKPFIHGGVAYMQYRGKVGPVSFIPDNEAYAYPVGVPDLFQTYFSPGTYMEFANTMGLPRYAKFGVDPTGFDKYIPMEAQTSPLSICTRPQVLYKLTSSN